MADLILDPFSGMAGDMMLGALVAIGLEPEWLTALPALLGLENVKVRVSDTDRQGIACIKVDFEVPPQLHGRHLAQILEILERSSAPSGARRAAGDAFSALADAEAAIHGVPIEHVHLHEVGAVDAILDIVGGIWGIAHLAIGAVYNTTVALGDGSVEAAHGVLPVPAPATLALLAGFEVKSGPAESGELTTPTGAVLLKVLSKGPPPVRYVPRRVGYGAGARNIARRPNVLRAILVDDLNQGSTVEELVLLSTDIDDMTPEHIGNALEHVRVTGALDVVVHTLLMKAGRPGWRVDVLVTRDMQGAVEKVMFEELSTIGIKRFAVDRIALERHASVITVKGQDVRMKVVTLSSGEKRAKPEFADVQRLASELGVPVSRANELILAVMAADLPGVS